MPCLSLNVLIPTWVTNIGRNGKTDVKLLFPHLHAVCHGQFNPCKLEPPCFCRTASLCIARKACKIKGGQILSTLPAICLVIKYHIITSIRLDTHGKLKNDLFLLVFAHSFPKSLPGFLPGDCNLNQKIILEENSFFCVSFFLINSSSVAINVSGTGLWVGWAITRCVPLLSRE